MMTLLSENVYSMIYVWYMHLIILLQWHEVGVVLIN